MYECKNKRASDNAATMYWETDRSKSTFSILCKPDGTYDFVNERSKWPTCLSDVQCDIPPVIPTNPEYVLNKDDGRVIVQRYIYPLPTTFITETLTSEVNNSLISKNFNTKLV